MKNAKWILSLLVGCLLFSCNSKHESMELSDMVASPPPPLKSTVKFTAPVITDEPVEEDEELKSQTEATQPNAVVNKKKIIRDGSISIKTKDISASKQGVESLVKSLGGYMDSEYLDNNDEQISFDLKVRIPAKNFDALLNGLENGKDEVKSKNIQARDVTEEFVDVEARIANKQVYLKRYKELLAKASTVRDILAIEEQIRVIQEEIESREGRLKYLNDQVAYSTLDVQLFMIKEFEYKPEQQDNFWERIKNALGLGWRSTVGFLLMIFAMWPLILVIFGVVYAVRWRKRRQKKAE